MRKKSKSIRALANITLRQFLEFTSSQVFVRLFYLLQLDLCSKNADLCGSELQL